MRNSSSLFEEEIRKRKVGVCRAFLTSGRLAPVRFAPSSEQWIETDLERLGPLVPHLTGITAILTPDGAADPGEGKRVAVLFSGGPAPGGHNVLAGIFSALGPGNELLGVRHGPKGLLAGELTPISADQIAEILNTGGFDFLGADRTKLQLTAQFDRVREVVRKYRLNGIIVVGGDDSNTNAVFLADALADEGCAVVGVPKTIDGDLQVGKWLPISFGFDTATKIYSELVGNILKDAASARKYWHFVKLMGRNASHVSLEVALQTRPTMAFITEEVAALKMTLTQVAQVIADGVIHRAEAGLPHGVVLLPEGLGEVLLAHDGEDRDFHGNLKLSQIPIETLILEKVREILAQAQAAGRARGFSFSAQTHFFGYEGRCGAPTVFDADFSFNLGVTAASLVLGGYTGTMAAVTDLAEGGKPVGIPLAPLLSCEVRGGQSYWVIRKTLVDLDSPAFRFFEAHRRKWRETDCFRSPGPAQLWGPLTEMGSLSVALDQGVPNAQMRLGKGSDGHG